MGRALRMCSQRLGMPIPQPRSSMTVGDTIQRSQRAFLRMNWLRVFGHAEASRMGQGVWQQRHTRAVRSEKWWDSVAAYGVGMRVIAAFFGLYAPDALTTHVSVFSHDFKRFKRLTKLATSSDGASLYSTGTRWVAEEE